MTSTYLNNSQLIKLSTFFKTIALAAVSILFMANSGGSPGNRSGSATDGEKTCSTQGGCHSNASQPILSQDLISTDIPVEGYVPGTNYQITLNPTSEGAGRWGFEMMVQDANEAAVGEFTSNGDGNIISGNATRITHKFASGGGGDTKTWVLDWKAPASGSGDLQIFVSVLAANGNGKTGGDKLIIDTLAIAENEKASLQDLLNQEIVLYPNPVVNVLHIKGFKVSNAQILIIDATGKKVIEQPYTETIEVQELPKGNYIFKLVAEQAVLTKTFVKY